MFRRENNKMSKTEMFVNAVGYLSVPVSTAIKIKMFKSQTRNSVLYLPSSEVHCGLLYQSKVLNLSIFYTELVQNIRECNKFLLN